jgi:hypothetical protein
MQWYDAGRSHEPRLPSENKNSKTPKWNLPFFIVLLFILMFLQLVNFPNYPPFGCGQNVIF